MLEKDDVNSAKKVLKTEIEKKFFKILFISKRGVYK
jgi:hypothetical protein|tara:strand:+ start:539 stop:646 length:108 start_codon:yes stop_codon:yes gene_type:complete